MDVATHTASFGLYPSLKDYEERIYSGGKHETTMLLTIQLNSMPNSVNAIVEIMVNNNSIADGVIDRKGSESRTFWLDGVNTIDIVLRKADSSQTGQYTISVPLSSAQ